MANKSKKRSILFIHPRGENWMPGEKDMSRIANIMPPIGLCSLAAWVEKHGHQAYIHDCYAFPGRDDKIMAQIASNPPDFIGFTSTTSSFLDAIRIAKQIREMRPEIPIIFGGVHITSMREKLMRHYPVIDYGVVGEGEIPLASLMESDFQDLSEIPGLLYRKADDIKFTGYGKKNQLLKLDELPFPAYGKLEGFPEAYKLPIFNYPKSPNATIVSSRGCPYQCSYCDRTVFQQSFRYNSARYMFDLVKHLNKEYGVRHINYYDDLFTLKRSRVVEFCELMINNKLGVTFNCAARSEHIDLDLLKLMKKAGCWMISLGIETGDPDLLALHRSNSDLQMIREKVALIRKAGIRTKGLFMVGLPGETEESIDKSINYALSLPLNDMNVAKFTPFPGSPAYDTIHDYGSFEENWEMMNCTNFIFIPRGFTKERLEERYHEFYRRHFERTHILFDYVTMLWRSPNSWLRFLSNLGDFLSVKNAFKSAGEKPAN
ncbi:MAG: B12-binding domain-containing radical SAM protein [Deltaproteobacteria bacterium]|nr:B12-binding domain-containing radical SAM protein [Deltaproteobacteria bacterium]